MFNHILTTWVLKRAGMTCLPVHLRVCQVISSPSERSAKHFLQYCEHFTRNMLMFMIMFSQSTAFAHLWIDRYVREEQVPTKSGQKTSILRTSSGYRITSYRDVSYCIVSYHIVSYRRITRWRSEHWNVVFKVFFPDSDYIFEMKY